MDLELHYNITKQSVRGACVDRPIRVLQLSESPYFGGINSHIRAILLGFQGQTAIEMRVAALPGKRDDRWLHDAMPEKRVSEIAASAAALRDHVEGNRIDIVHTHNYRATLLCASARLNVPVVNTCHGQIAEPSLKLRGYQWLEVRAMRKSRATIAVSDFVKRWLLARGLDVARVQTVYNGYERTEPVQRLVRAELGIDDAATVFLYAGRLVREKGVRDFLRALRGCAGAHGIVLGDGPLRAECAAAASNTSVRLHCAGLQKDVAAYYALADVVVLPSRMEALPMTLIEAAAHGRPAIATRVGGVPEVVHDGETGILVDPGDIDQLRAAMLTCRDAELRDDLGLAAQARWQALFRRSRMVESLAEIYVQAFSR